MDIALAGLAVVPLVAQPTDVLLMDGAHRFIERTIAEARAKRPAPDRERLRKIVGLVDQRLPSNVETFGSEGAPALVAETQGYSVYQVRWDVLPGVHGEGLWLRPPSPAGYVVALPDADQAPEQIAGLAPGVPPDSQFARALAERGFEVLVPTLIDRGTQWSGRPEFRRRTVQTHREWIYRQAFHMGRHVIGYEVQKVLAAVDYFALKSRDVRVGVAGYGEGGLIAFYAAAVDERIRAALVSGYFSSREEVWREPIYRNVWGLLKDFGDAEIASLIGRLVVEYAPAPNVAGHKGDLATPRFSLVQGEFERIAGLGERKLIGGPGPVSFGSEEAVSEFAAMLGGGRARVASSPGDWRVGFDPNARQKRQVAELERHVQGLVRASEHVRDEQFLFRLAPEMADRTWDQRLGHRTPAPDGFVEGARERRRYFQEEVIGRFDHPYLPPNARMERIYDTETFVGYDVVLDVYPDLIAWGILLVPKDIEEGERRPVVVCQHGRNGLPKDTVEGDTDAYHDFAARLAERGFVTFSPHNLYRGEDRYRWLDRKANSVKASLFSFVVAQHEQILNWLPTLPYVDKDRIAFYGLSYGGETAVRVPTILEGYALSICSADFNNWTRKIAATDQRFSFMYTIEWEMPYFDMGSTFDYAEMAYLMFPRPFMVERGHYDRVGRDRWVAHEYAKVRLLYDHFGLGERTRIEWFPGGHTIRGEGTFEFLHERLGWPAPEPRP